MPKKKQDYFTKTQDKTPKLASKYSKAWVTADLARIMGSGRGVP